MERRDCALEIIAVGRRERSDIPWDNALKTAEKIPSNSIPVVQNAYYGGDSQKWKLEFTPDGCSFYIRCKKSGNVLDVLGSSLANFTSIILFGWHGGNNQRWVLTEMSVR